MVVVVYTIPYGTIAGTRLPVIPPFETFLSFFGGIFTSGNICGIYTVSYGTIAGIYTLVVPPLNSRFMPSVLRPPFGTFIVTYWTIGVSQNLHCFLWNYRRYFTDVTSIFYLRWAPLFEVFRFSGSYRW